MGMSHQFPINVINAFYNIIFIAFSMFMIHGYCSWNIFDHLFKCLQFLKGCLNAILQFPSHSQENLENTHTHTHTHTHTPDCYSLKNHGQRFFLNHLFLQFNSRINVDFSFANSPYLKKFVEFYIAKTNSAKIYIFLNIYSVKIYSFQVTQTY